MENLNVRVKHWTQIAEKVVVVCALVGSGVGLGYLMGAQGTSERLAWLQTNHVEELTRLQASHTATITALTALIRTTATATARAAAKVERAADTAATAADTASDAATSAKGAAQAAKTATRNSAPPPATVNKSVKDANKQLGVRP